MIIFVWAAVLTLLLLKWEVITGRPRPWQKKDLDLDPALNLGLEPSLPGQIEIKSKIMIKSETYARS